MSSLSRLTRLLNARQRVLLVGPPGCGKTALVLAAATACGYKVVLFRTSLAERVDLAGCYVPDLASGITRALPLALLAELRNTNVPTILFLDDLGQAPTDVQAACMTLFDDGSISPEVLIWGATNRPGDKSGVTALCEPLRSRFHVAFAIATPTTESTPSGPTYLSTWAAAVEGWLDWASGEDFDSAIIAWHRSTSGRTLYAWKPAADPAARFPDFRSWATVGRLFAAGITDLDTVSAAIGRGTAAEFLAFAALADQLPTPQQVWMDPDGAALPTEPAAQYLIATMLGRACEPKFAGAFIRYISRLPRVQGAFAARDAFRRVGARLAGNKEWQTWFLANQELFAVAV